MCFLVKIVKVRRSEQPNFLLILMTAGDGPALSVTHVSACLAVFDEHAAEHGRRRPRAQRGVLVVAAACLARPGRTDRAR